MSVEKIKENLRTFSLTEFAVHNATSILILSIMILVMGLYAYRTMPKEMYPEASLPQVYINTPYFGNSAEDIENLITRPIEKEISTISGVKYLNSTNIQDFSVIIVEFEADQDQDEVTRKVKDAVDKAKSELPTDLDTDPTVMEVNFSEFPIMSVNVSGNYGMDELREIAEYLQDKMESMSAINKVDLKGALDREVKVDLDVIKMQALQISFNDVEAAIAQENMSMSAGELVSNDFRRSIRVVGEFESIDELNNVIVKSENANPIYLKDVAGVTYGYEERNSYARSNKLPVIALDVVKRRGENVIDAAQRIKDLIQEEKPNLPPDINLAVFNDTSKWTKESVSNLENSVIAGVILVILVLLFFLGLRNSLFVGMAIPLSMLTGVLILAAQGTTMNIIVLFGLILALGLLVDNAIVVVENVYRYVQNGYSAYDAARYGAGEVAWPIIASTATTLAAFFPLAVWPGVMGEFMRYFPITLIAVLSASLFVALVINPVLMTKFMKLDEKAETALGRRRRMRNVLIGAGCFLAVAILGHFAEKMWVRNLFALAAIVSLVNFFIFRPGAFFLQNRGLPFLERQYHRFVGIVLKGAGPYLTFLGTIAMMFFAYAIFKMFMPKVEYFPNGDPEYVNVFVELPLGSDIKATNEVVKSIETDILNGLSDYEDIVEEVLTQIGEETSDPNQPPEPGVTPHKARITTSFISFQDRGDLSSSDAMEAIRTSLGSYPGVSITVAKDANGPPTGRPINIEVVGDDIDQLSALSEKMIVYLSEQNVPGVEGLKTDVRLAKPELEVNIDRESARRYGLSTAQIASALRTSVFGKEVSKYKVGEDEYPIMVRLSEKDRYNTTTLMNQKITFRDQMSGQIIQIPISAVADYRYSTSYNSIRRKDQKRMITVYSNVIDGYNTNEINADLEASLANFDMPEGYSFEFTGEQQQQAEDMSFLMGAFLFAIAAIFLIIVAQFNSLYTPVIIVASVLFSTIGVFLGYALTGKTLSVVFTGVGIISLAGIVVNNAIVLIDYINLLIKRKREELGINSIFLMDKADVRQAVIEGGATRLRPVLLTAITTVLGLIPLATGTNINFSTIITDLDPQYYAGGNSSALWGSLAWTVIYGLTFATFLTLVVVPAMYWLAYRFRFRTEGWSKKKKEFDLAKI